MKNSADSSGNNFISLGGRSISLGSAWESARFDLDGRRILRESFLNAKPFPHLVIEDIFNPELLELIHDEFSQVRPQAWRHSKSDNESTHRSMRDAIVTPGAEFYFTIIYSRAFLRFLTDITGIGGLIPDPELIGGGMHESRTGDWFNVHVDFAKHPTTFLSNEIVLLTYLNRDWRDEYGGSLELWDRESRSCVKTITPSFGRTVILKHSKASLHGHTKPICAPDGRPRRSVAAYYYGQHDKVVVSDEAELASIFLTPRKTMLSQVKGFVRAISPPIFVQGFKRMRRMMNLNKDWNSSANPL